MVVLVDEHWLWGQPWPAHSIKPQNFLGSFLGVDGGEGLDREFDGFQVFMNSRFR